MDSSTIIFKGSEENVEITESSFGEFIYSKLKELPPEKFDHIHAGTGQEMSNKDFLELSERVACGLETMGFSAGDVVVVMGENSMNISAAATGCILINAAFAPLDPSLTPYELANILKAYQPKCIFCNTKEIKKVSDSLNSLHHNASIILLDTDSTLDGLDVLGFGSILKNGNKLSKKHEVKDISTQIAFIMPSSGSTGPPKGVALSHKTALWMLKRICSRPVFSGIFLQTSHLFWMSGLFSLLSSYVGVTRVFLDKLDLDYILSAIQQYKADLAFLSPSHLATLIKKPDLTPNTLGPLKVMLTGGGPLQKYVADEFQKLFKPFPILTQFYALTENAGNVTSFAPSGDVMSVGVIESGVQIKILDLESEKTLPEEIIGEIRVKHAYQMIGYVGNHEATQEAFDEDGWLKTGDLGFMKAGLLYLTGRIKAQIKYRNMQISPTEIEDLLISLDGVEDVGVEGIPHEEDHYHPMALIVKRPDAKITAHDIHKFVEDTLSSHKKLRGGVVFVDRIPRSTHSKLKRKDLRELALRLHSKSIKPM